MGTDTLRGFLSCSLLAALSIGFSPLQSSDEPARVKVLVERIERVSRDKVQFWLKVTNRSDRPVFLYGIDYESLEELLTGPNSEARPRRSEPRLYPVYLEQWRRKEGWKIVGPCLDTEPPHVIKLNPGEVMAFDSALVLPLPSVCKVRNIQLQSKFRFRLEYFDSEKQARAYVKRLFSSRWQQARAPVAVSEPFEIPPTPSPER